MKKLWLALWFEAPLQSWGADSKFYRRETMDFPTKSGVLGLICCALGKGGEQKEFLSQFSPLLQNSFSFKKSSKLHDYQTVGSNYNKDDPWEKFHIPKTIDNKAPTNTTGSKLILRSYLQDMFFGVALEIPQSFENEIVEALKNPVWDIFLGRKNCTPTDYIYRGTFDSQNVAEKAITEIAKQKGLRMIFKVIDGNHQIKNSHFKEDVFTIKDVPLQFGQFKKYKDRIVTKVHVEDLENQTNG
jgi:CRISPR system Cascade subunit CasD